ncbi:MAG TPA: proprotein convertase P-domain-containing protein, partial [Blastocatellia bacterium]|nr:proprotein convertase P-domain-containing protein [Blastocatellia bacterium]
MTHRIRTSTRVVFTLMCLAVLVGLPAAQAVASTRLAAQMSAKDQDTARLVQLDTTITNLRARLVTDPGNAQLQTKLNAAMAESASITARLGGDRVGATGVPAAGSAPSGSISVPPNCTGSTVNFSNNTPVAINDNVTVTSQIVVSGANPYLFDVNAQTFITHTFNGDIDMTLTSPAGTIVTLTTDNGGGNDNVFNGTVWDDDANPGGALPYTNNNGLVGDQLYANLTLASPLAPEEALAAFIGEDPNGTWTLSISDDATGDTGSLASWSLNIVALTTAPTNAAPVVATNNTPVAINDNSVATSTVNVAGAGASVCKVTVTTNITHTFAGDIDMTLTSPAGTIVTLTSDNGGGNDNVFNGTVWDDDANPGGAVPYTNNNGLATDHLYANLTLASPLAPEEALGAFIGENPNGTWTLSVGDDATGDTGSLASWSISVVTCQCQIIVGTCSLTCPADQLVTATDATGAVVNYPAPTDNG